MEDDRRGTASGSDTGRSSKSRRGLGRGLGALIVNTDPERDISPEPQQEGLAHGVQLIALNAISPNPQQPRANFDEEALVELAASIREHGVIQPLIVTQDPEHPVRYWLIAGERRLRAAQLAELDEAPCIVREATTQQLLELALVENVQRADLNALEEATAYQMLVDRFGLTQEVVAQRVGRSRSAVANTIRLLSLPVSVQQALIEYTISAGHARALLSLPDDDLMEQALDRIVDRGLNVRQTEELVKVLLRSSSESDMEAEPDGEARALDAHVQYLENRFRNALGTRVNLNRNSDGSGRLVVHFFNDEDLESLLEIIASDEDEI